MAFYNTYQNLYEITADYLGVSVTVAAILLAIVGIWSLIWKGIALWKSSRKNQMVWFIFLLVVNTVGILEILYIFIFSKMSGKKVKTVNSKSSKRKR